MPEFLGADVYRSVLDGLQVGVYILDLERKIVFWNQGAERITGFLRQEVMGRFCHDNILVPCDEGMNVLCGTDCPLLHVMHEGCSRELDALVRHKEGHRLVVRVRAMPIRSRDGEVVGAAESFEELRSAPDPDHREDGLIDGGLLDETTGVLRRDQIDLLLQHALAQFVEAAEPFSVLCFKVNHGERFRATYGQRAEDAILRVVARTLQSNLRTDDRLGRWNADEFLVLAVECGARLKEIGKRLERVARVSGIRWWGDRLSAPVSWGSATIRAGESVTALIARARERLDWARVREGVK